MEEKEFRLAYDMVKGKRMRGLLVEEAAEELSVSPRSIFRMMKDGRLKAEKWGLPYGENRFYWLISPVSVAKLLLQKETTGKKTYPRASNKEAGKPVADNKQGIAPSPTKEAIAPESQNKGTQSSGEG